MIQRIQSVYLILTTILPVLFLKGSLLEFYDKSGSVIKFCFTGIYREIPEHVLSIIKTSFPISAMILLIPFISIISVFLYKKRRLQMRFVLLLTITVLTFITTLILYSFYILNSYDAYIIPGYKMVIPVLLLILSALAYKGIRKDERLVRSYDRLR